MKRFLRVCVATKKNAHPISRSIDLCDKTDREK